MPERTYVPRPFWKVLQPTLGYAVRRNVRDCVGLRGRGAGPGDVDLERRGEGSSRAA
jgi:hypothetical protein